MREQMRPAAPSSRDEKRVLIVCEDLMFKAPIRDAAAAQGAQAEFIASVDEFAQAIERHGIVLLMADLHHSTLGGENAGGLIAPLRASENAGAQTLAWGKHTEPALLHAAREAGFDRVLPRSSFVKEMPQIISEAAAGARAPR